MSGNDVKEFHHTYRNKVGCAVCLMLMLAVITLPAAAGSLPPLSPGPGDKCPVCGMFVAKYPDWVAQVRFRDQETVFFDGAKDFFKYYFGMTTYHPARSTDDVAALYVTDYYTMQPIDAASAIFVAGSDIYGPMGRELIPFASATDAQTFMRDHRGRQALPFAAVTLELVKSLD